MTPCIVSAVRSDDELLHYVAECPVNYVIELNPFTTGRNNALVECERTLWKIVYDHCQGQQTCKVSLPWVDMLKHKIECLNEIEDYRPFHYQCRSCQYIYIYTHSKKLVLPINMLKC